MATHRSLEERRERRKARVKAYNHAYYLAHKPYMYAKSRRWAQEHRELLRQRDHLQYLARPRPPRTRPPVLPPEPSPDARFFYGTLCLRGHDRTGSGRSLRRWSSHVCCDCEKMFNHATEAKRKAQRRERRNQHEQAIQPALQVV